MEETGSGNSRKRKTVREESERSIQLKLNKRTEQDEEEESTSKIRITELGNGSSVVYYPRFIDYQEAWKLFDYLNNHIPWTRPTIRVFGRSCVQPRDSCYVASEGVSELKYSGYQPEVYPWQQFPPLQQLLQAVQGGVTGSRFNSLLLNRYNGGNDYVSWHSDDESIYGPTPLIASLSFGCDRHFYLKKKPIKSSPALKKNSSDECSSSSKLLKKSKNGGEQHSLLLKHGSLLLMKGYTQRDWIHSVPKRTKLDAVRINLTFRLVL